MVTAQTLSNSMKSEIFKITANNYLCRKFLVAKGDSLLHSTLRASANWRVSWFDTSFADDICTVSVKLRLLLFY
jgi:hypothetical protein